MFRKSYTHTPQIKQQFLHDPMLPLPYFYLIDSKALSALEDIVIGRKVYGTTVYGTCSYVLSIYKNEYLLCMSIIM